MNKLSVFTDGAARGNPGPGGYGVVISYNQQTEIGVDEKGEKLYKTEIISKEYSAGYKQTTNNRMEMMAAIRALEEIKEPSEISLYSDSQYLVNAINKNWIESWISKGWKKSDGNDVKNQDLWKKLISLMKPHKVSFIWVKGHNGHPLNERCDQLATNAADNNATLDDVAI
jgi:ribonuclease HI